MITYKLIARAKIHGIDDDEGLRTLNGYAELVREYDNTIPFSILSEEMIDAVNEKYPDYHFEQYDFETIDELR